MRDTNPLPTMGWFLDGGNANNVDNNVSEKWKGWSCVKIVKSGNITEIGRSTWKNERGFQGCFIRTNLNQEEIESKMLLGETIKYQKGVRLKRGW